MCHFHTIDQNHTHAIVTITEKSHDIGTYYAAQAINVTSLFMNDCNNSNNDHRMDHQYDFMIIGSYIVEPASSQPRSQAHSFYLSHQYALVLCTLSYG